MKEIHHRVKSVGEVGVWLTAMGLAVGLLMVVSLLALVVWNGAAVFWPRAVAQIELKPGASGLGEARTLAGVVAKTRLRADRARHRPGDEHREWHLFVGNKDVYGFGFKYVDLADAERVSFPADLMMLERTEYGDAIGFPLTLSSAAGESISFAADPERFRQKLQALVREGTVRRLRIRRLERGEIGAVNERMRKVQERRKALDGGRVPPAEVEGRRAALDREQERLQKEYRALAERAADERREQPPWQVAYRLATGQERVLGVGQVIHFHFPNRMSAAERAAHFVRRAWQFVSTEPREANTEGGIFPAIFGTFVMTLLMSVAVMPFGVLAAIYLREYARQGLFVRMVRISVNNLAGVPSIVFGVFGLGFFVYFLGGSLDRMFYSLSLPTPTFGTGGILWASLTLALMTVPVVIVAAEEALAAVPRGMREGSLALGASKWQTIYRVVLPGSSTGILTGLILAMARGAGEVAPLMLVGVVKLAPSLPIDGLFPYLHLDRKFMHLGFHIYDLGFQSPDSDAAQPMVFATTFFLIALVVALNLGAIVIRERLRRKYAAAAF
jgi:phosphate transport system permease protein